MTTVGEFAARLKAEERKLLEQAEAKKRKYREWLRNLRIGDDVILVGDDIEKAKVLKVVQLYNYFKGTKTIVSAEGLGFEVAVKSTGYLYKSNEFRIEPLSKEFKDHLAKKQILKKLAEIDFSDYSLRHLDEFKSLIESCRPNSGWKEVSCK